MTVSIWLSYLVYAFITGITPGPNNILVLNSVSTYGLKKSRRLLLGVFAGFFSIMVLCGTLSSTLSKVLPDIVIYLKYLGVAYILWLSWHIISSKPNDITKESKPMSFMQGYLLQFINIKIILYGMTLFTGYVLPYYSSISSILFFIILATFIGNGASLLWAIFGAVFSNFLQKHWKVCNIVMAVLLLYSAYGIAVN